MIIVVVTRVAVSRTSCWRVWPGLSRWRGRGSKTCSPPSTRTTPTRWSPIDTTARTSTRSCYGAWGPSSRTRRAAMQLLLACCPTRPAPPPLLLSAPPSTRYLPTCFFLHAYNFLLPSTSCWVSYSLECDLMQRVVAGGGSAWVVYVCWVSLCSCVVVAGVVVHGSSTCVECHSVVVLLSLGW